MTAVLRLGVVTIVALLLQLTLFTEVRVLGVAPELLALVAVLAGLFAGAQQAAVAGFVIGLLWDVYTPAPAGMAALSFALVATATGAATRDLYRETRLQTVIVATVGTAAATGAYALLGELLGQHNMVTSDLPRVLLIASVLNGLLSVVVAPTVRWAIQLRPRLRSI